MSALTRFQPKLTIGHLRYHIDDDKVIEGYLKCDGSTVLKNTYPELLDVIGLRTTQNGSSGVLRDTNTTSNINALTYGDETFVLGIDQGISNSADGINWSQELFTPPIYVGGKTFARAGNTSPETITLTDLTGGANTAPQEGDLVVIAVATGSDELRSRAVTGYTQIASLYSNDTETDTNLWVGYKIMGSTPDTTVTIPTSGDTSDAQTVAIQVWRNVVYEDVTTAIGENTVLADPPSITTTTGNNVVLVIGAGGHDAGTQTYAASYADNFLTIGSDDTFQSTIGFGSVNRPTAGAYDPPAFTFTGAIEAHQTFAAASILLMPTSINALTYANNTFVCAGTGGILATSTDGTTWTKRTSGTASKINALTYANNTFVYAGDSGALATSTNAISWVVASPALVAEYVGGKTFARAGATTGTSISLTDLAFGESAAPQAGDLVIIAVATGSTVLRSRAVTGYTQIASLYSDDDIVTNLWVGRKIMGSTPDTEVTIPESGSTSDAQTVAIQVWRNVEYVDATTTTGTNTVLADPPSITTTTDKNVVLFIGAGGHSAGTQTYAASYADNFLTIGSGDTYDSTIGFGSIYRSVAGLYDPAAFTFSGSTSTNFSFAAVTIALRSRNINALTYANNTFVYAGNGGVLATSPDGNTWTTRTSGTANNINALTYGDGTFVYAGDGGVLATSSNGNTWITRTSGTANNINGLAFNDFENLFSFVSNGGVIATSSNAVTWTQQTSNTTQSLNTIIYVEGAFVYAGDGGVLGTLSNYTYDPAVEFILPTTNNLFTINNDPFKPTAFIKYE
jgi:hypothetical protein